MKFLKMNSIILIVLFSVVLQLFSLGSHFVRADEEDRPPPNARDFEDDTETTKTEPTKNTTESEKERERTFNEFGEEVFELRPSRWAETSMVYVQPPGAKELPAGKEVKLVAGLYNKGDKDFLVDRIEAAFHYPLDYNYHIQNFTTVRYGQRVEAGRHASFDYSFMPSDMLASRTFGISITLFYNDSDGKSYRSAVHNSTVNIYEPEEGFDGETFFLYLTLAAFIVLGLVGGHHFIVMAGLRRLKSSSKSRPLVETGTQGNKSDIDYDWLPESALNKPSTGGSPKGKTSPRLRSAAIKRKSGAADN